MVCACRKSMEKCAKNPLYRPNGTRDIHFMFIGCDMHTAYASHFFNSSSHLLSVSFWKASRRCSLPGAKRCFNLPCFFQKFSRENRSFLHYSARYKETRFVKLLIMVFSSIASVKYPSSSSIISICNSLGIFFSGIAPSISSLSVFRSASLSI